MLFFGLIVQPLLLAAALDVPVDDNAPIFHVSPAGCRGGVAPLHHGWTNGAPAHHTVSPSVFLCAAVTLRASSLTPDDTYSYTCCFADPNGPFEYKGTHHIFYQSRGSATVWSHGPTFWGHAAGNLSHWHCEFAQGLRVLFALSDAGPLRRYAGRHRAGRRF